MIIKINAKCSDMCHILVQDKDGTVLADKDGYVPDFIPNEYGDYLTLEIDAKTGKILNWSSVSKTTIKQWSQKTR